MPCPKGITANTSLITFDVISWRSERHVATLHGSERNYGSWDEQAADLLKKKFTVKAVMHFRQIQIIQVLCTLHSRVLLSIVGDRAQGPQFAFRKGLQVHEVVII
jgi:hypothetical protein